MMHMDGHGMEKEHCYMHVPEVTNLIVCIHALLTSSLELAYILWSLTHH